MGFPAQSESATTGTAGNTGWTNAQCCCVGSDNGSASAAIPAPPNPITTSARKHFMDGPRGRFCFDPGGKHPILPPRPTKIKVLWNIQADFSSQFPARAVQSQ